MREAELAAAKGAKVRIYGYYFVGVLVYLGWVNRLLSLGGIHE